LLRTRVDPLIGDRWLHDDIESARAMLASGELRAAVERAVGPLVA
jgi:histidine ammonia-lyase